MKIHLARIHGLAPDLPGLSQKEWVDRQVQSLANKYAQAKLDEDKQETNHIYKSLTVLYYRHKDIITLEDIARALERGQRRFEDRTR
jgi:hypothetical protein